MEKLDGINADQAPRLDPSLFRLETGVTIRPNTPKKGVNNLRSTAIDEGERTVHSHLKANK